MKKFFSFMVRQSVAIILVVVFVLAFGIYSATSMAINLLPDINVPMVCVQVIYAGANAKSVETDVTVKLEEGLSAISGVTDVTSYSYDNLSAVVLSFDYGADTTEKKTDIQSKLNTIDLPDGVSATVYDIDLNAEALAVLSVISKEGEDDAEKLENAYSAARELAAKLNSIDGVESVEIKGGADYSYYVRPFIGLELICPLIVQAFSYGSLDLPLGNVDEDGENVQIRNASDVLSEDDILNMPLALPSSLVSLFSSVKQIMKYYQNSSADDLVKLREDLGNGVQAVLAEIDEMTYSELEDLAALKTYMNIASSFTAENLTKFKTSRYYDEIYKQCFNEDEEGNLTPKTDDELEEIVEEIAAQYPAFSTYISTDMLKVVRDNKTDLLIAYRQDYLEQTEGYLSATENNEYYSLTDDDYYVLETRYVKVFGGEFGYTEEYFPIGTEVTFPEDDGREESDRYETIVLQRIDFVKQTSATGLASIADKKREEGDGYCPTDAECAVLFSGTELSSEHPIIMSPTFMAFVRADSYEANMQVLIDRRGELAEENAALDEETGEAVEGDITAAQFYELFRRLDLTGIFEFTLSEELINFILVTDLSNLSTDSGGNSVLVVKTGDVAAVSLSEEFSSYVYFGSRDYPQVIHGTIIEIYKSNGANSSAVVEEVKKIYAEYLTGSRTYGASVNLLDDQSEFISDSIVNVLESMLIGGLLAIIVIFVFLKKVRLSLVIAITMPLSVLAALICLNLMGITLNMVSLGGLAVGIGMLVDNSIVVIESISKHRDMDKSAYDAAVDGASEVGGALFGSTITTVCVFIPILFTGGLTAEIFTDLCWAVIYSLSFSLIFAVTVIPALYSLFGGGKRMLKGGRLGKTSGGVTSPEQAQPREENVSAVSDISCDDIGIPAETVAENTVAKKTFRKKCAAVLAYLKESRAMAATTRFYGGALPKILNHKLITIILAIVIFGSSIGLLFLTGTEFLPSIDKGQIEVNLNYGSSSELSVVNDDVLKFANTINENIENIDYISVSIGKNGLLALTDTGLITVQLTTNRGTSEVVEQIRALSESAATKPLGSATIKEIDGVVASLTSGMNDMSVTIVGDDGQTLKDIAGKISDNLKAAGFTDVTDTSTESSTEYDLKFDRFKMAELGLDYQTLILTLRIGIASYTACDVTIDGSSFNLNVSFADGAVADRESLENFVVGADGADAVKLKDVLVPNGDGEYITVVETEACIRRSNGREMVSVSAAKNSVDTGTASSEMQKIAQEVLEEYEGFSFKTGGVSNYLNEAFKGLAVALVISFFLLYAVMAVQFSSAVTPLIIMASIPFSFTGGFVALVITGTSLNVVSFIGLIMLMGVVVNNAIVMLEKIKQLHVAGMSHYDAVQEACKTRLRPILMTTLTTILALIPMAVGVGQGSELMQPLGIVVIGGLLIGTLVTLALVPAVYCAVYGISKKRVNGRKGAKAE